MKRMHALSIVALSFVTYTFLALFLLFISTSALAQSESKAPTLSETLTWLSGASEIESSDGNDHHTFENKGNSSCAVVITETRLKAGPGFWIKESFSLADIDPADIYVEDLGQGLSSVTFHTTNYSDKILSTSNGLSEKVPTSGYIFLTNVWFAPRFTKALKRAAEHCGAKPSAF